MTLQTLAVIVITLIILATGFLALLLRRRITMRGLFRFTVNHQCGIGDRYRGNNQ
ncbi:MAG: hypothetical protein QNL03_01905 [Gammaproteobacteria bacterium]|nr:hypothetical protein [Gammaproteobacteria bacterium]